MNNQQEPKITFKLIVFNPHWRFPIVNEIALHLSMAESIDILENVLVTNPTILLFNVITT